MLSSMTPTILAKDGQLFMVTGSPGGRTIINTVLETIVNVVDFGMNAQEAIDAPRFHHQWLPDRLDYEKYGLSADTVAELERRGHTLRAGPAARAWRRSSSTTRRKTCSKAAPIAARPMAPRSASPGGRCQKRPRRNAVSSGGLA